MKGRFFRLTFVLLVLSLLTALTFTSAREAAVRTHDSALRPEDPALLASHQTRAWVSKRIVEWLPTDHERLWEKIGWTVGIQRAFDRARTLNRPVCLFSYAGAIEGRL